MERVLECPVCARALVTLGDGAAELPVCELCGGIWLDKERVTRVMGGELTQDERQVAREASRRFRARRERGGYRSAPRAEERERCCAECDAPMKPLGIEMLDIVVDGCAAHGCWFDLGELGVVARWFELRARGLDESTARLALLLQRASTNSRRSRKKKRKKKKKASR